ncbi:Zn-ribbon-containing, possible RNA-binding protein-like protein [Legionella oakridgensis]|nr:Zn-ribbon-containing, possible RNA-binding protein-like protein [Legionella oakridgensis]
MNLLFYSYLIKISKFKMRSISHCLNKQLAEICQRSFQLEELSRKVKQLLPENLVKECYVGSFNKGCLILTTTNAVWATQLRYILPELRDRLRKEAGLYQLSSIKVTVNTPSFQQEEHIQLHKNALSERAKATIVHESQQCTYEPLQKALLRLADHEEK